jgi:sn-glycerol 3-phosphate transport system ATP-binding protein
MRLEIQKMHRTLGTTSLYVTHDQVEAMTLGQRMIVMNAGNAEQIGTPVEVYDKPTSTFVAGFIGSPPMNLLRGKVESDGSGFQAGEGVVIPLPAGSRAPQGRDCILGVRPEHLVLGQPGMALAVEMVEALGSELLVYGRTGGQSVVIRTATGTRVAVGDRVTAGFDASGVHWFDPQTTRRLD